MNWRALLWRIEKMDLKEYMKVNYVIDPTKVINEKRTWKKLMHILRNIIALDYHNDVTRTETELKQLVNNIYYKKMTYDDI